MIKSLQNLKVFCISICKFGGLEGVINIMKDNKLKSITIRVDSGVYETIEEMKWIERKKQSELLRELLEIGLKTKVKEGKKIYE